MMYKMWSVFLASASVLLTGTPQHGGTSVVATVPVQPAGRPTNRTLPVDTTAMEFFGVVSASDSTPVADASVGCVWLKNVRKQIIDSTYMVHTDVNGKYSMKFQKYYIDKRGFGHVILPDGGDCIVLLAVKKGYNPMQRYLQQSPIDFVLKKN